MSTSALLRVFAAVRPPNPDPTMTTLCRSDTVAPGWLIANSLADYLFDTTNTLAAALPQGAVKCHTGGHRSAGHQDSDQRARFQGGGSRSISSLRSLTASTPRSSAAGP